MDNCNVLTDPVFSSRSSPVQFAGPKRYRHVPCTVHDLPRIDAVVISHTHYDHLDLPTVQAISARFGSDIRWFVPLGLASWMHSNGCDNVIELDWWDENCIPEHPNIKFVFTPAQHWCKRTPLDDNKVCIDFFMRSVWLGYFIRVHCRTVSKLHNIEEIH